MQETQLPIHGLGRSPGEGNGSPLQYSCLGNPMDSGPWVCKEWDTTQQQQQIVDCSLSQWVYMAVGTEGRLSLHTRGSAEGDLAGGCQLTKPWGPATPLTLPAGRATGSPFPLPRPRQGAHLLQRQLPEQRQ